MAPRYALCASIDLPLTQAEPPRSLLVLPAGDMIRGRDGRAWTLSDRAAVLAQLARLNRPVQLDENHAAVHSAPRGGSAPAAGWLSGWRFTEAGLEADVEWTPLGERFWREKAYRYVSPALLHDGRSGNDTLGNITGLHSVGLTNDPNLELPALNAAEDRDMNEEQLKALGLTKDATPEQVAARVAELSKPAGVDAIQAQITAGFAALAEALKALKPEAVAANSGANAHEIAVNAVLDAGVAAGKVLPASRAFLAATAKDAAGLTALQAHIEALPRLAPNSSETPKPENGGGAKLSPDALKIYRMLGVDPTKI